MGRTNDKMSSVAVDMAIVKKDLSRHMLGELPSDSDLEEVTHLDLSHNHLTSLPASVSRLFSNLVNLDLSVNSIQQLPPQICTLHKLQILTAKHNAMKSLPQKFGELKGLQELNLSGNDFEQFPPQICDLDGLEYLHLGANHISQLPNSINKMTSLSYFYIGGNSLEVLPPELGELENLSALNLCDNKLTYLPKQLNKLSKLHSLQLHNNQLQTLPQDLVKLTNLRELSLRNNPLVVRFVKEWPNNVASLLEQAGKAIKKNDITYNPELVPPHLVDFLDKAQHCCNPMCNGVYFSSSFQSVSFVDFCGKYRVPLMQYLCSPMCVHEEACRYGHTCGGDHSGSEEEEEAAKHKIKKVLLG